MAFIPRILAASGTDHIDVAGNFVHVKSTNRPFAIRFAGDYIEVDQGDQVQPVGGFDGFDIENIDAANALNVELVCGYGAFRQGQLVGQISQIAYPVTVETAAGAPLDVSASEVAIIPGAAPLNIANESAGTLYASSTNSIALQTIVTPAANTNGMVVHASSVCCSPGVDLGRMMVNGAAPSSVDDGVAVCATGSASGLGMYVAEKGERNFYVPAGFGMYAQSKTAGNVIFSVSYTLL